jgi:hypothetical protein
MEKSSRVMTEPRTMISQSNQSEDKTLKVSDFLCRQVQRTALERDQSSEKL